MEIYMDENVEKINEQESAELTEVTETEEVAEETEQERAPENPEALPEKTEIVGVRFKKEGKTYYFAPNGFTLSKDDRVIVDTSRGQEYGFVAVANSTVRSSELVLPLREVVRLATEEDTRIHSENCKREIEAYNTCIALIDEHNPKMKLIDVECAFDRSKLLFYFSAEERVDFREIVKALATAFHTRIEMRQIGIRDEAKMLGGLGVCGRPFCCSAFLTDFVQVSVKMAKEQNISLNAAKISGACGKLMCCLRYEYDTYLAEKALTPKVGTRVMTPDGLGEVTESNPLAGIVKVRLDGKAEDAEQTVYVREDVVKEDEYNGETLTKTEIPKRGKNKEEEDVFSSFASVISGNASTPVETKNDQQKQSAEKNKNDRAQNKNNEQSRNNAQQNKPAVQPKNTAAEQTAAATVKKDVPAEGQNEGGENRGSRHRRKKHKGHGGQNGQGQPSQNRPEQGAQTKAAEAHPEGQQSRPQGDQRRQDGQNRHQSGHRHGNNGAQQKAEGRPQGQQNEGGEGQPRQNGQGGHGRHRHFKHHNKNRGPHGGQNGQGGGQAE